MIGYGLEEQILQNEFIAKATASEETNERRPPLRSNSRMDRLFSAAKKKLTGSHSKSGNSLAASRDFQESLQYSNSTRTRQTTVSSLQLESCGRGGAFERPETDAEIYALYAQAMLKLGVDVEKIPALKMKSADEMWQMICSAGAQERDEKHTPEYFANTLASDSKNSHLNVAFLKSLRIELGSKPLSWNDDFARFGGWDSILESFSKLKTIVKLDAKLPALRELMKIFRTFTNNKMGLDYVFGDSKRALASLKVVVDVFSVPCMQCRLGALETILTAALIEQYQLEPVIIQAFRENNSFPVFAGILSESFNAIRSVKDADLYTFLLDSMILVNSLIAYGYETKDLDFRMKLRGEIFNLTLQKSLNKYKTINDERMTNVCEAYLNKAHADAEEFMARFDKTERELKTPLNLMQTVAEVLEDDSVLQDSFYGLLMKMLIVSGRQDDRLRYLVAIDGLFEETLKLSTGHAVDLEKLTFKGKEEKALFLTLQKSKEKLEFELKHANKRLENMANLQKELETSLEAKGQRLIVLSDEKKALLDEFNSKLALHESTISKLKAELDEKDRNERKSLESNEGNVLQMANLQLDSPIEKQENHQSLTFIPPPPPLPNSCGGPSFIPLPPPPPMPQINVVSMPPPPPPMPCISGFVPPPPPFPMPGSLGLALPPAPPSFMPPQVRVRPKPVGKTRQLQWEKLAQVKGTIWEEIDDSKWEKDIDYVALENTFKYDPKVSKQSFPQERRISFSTTGSALMDPKKARNMQIILGRLKLSPQELRTSLLKMDANVWTESIAREIIKYLPSPAELDDIARFFADNDEAASAKPTAEKMALELSKIKGLEERLLAIELMSLVGEWHVEASEQLETILKSVGELKEKDSLKSFLGLVLAAGNFLNNGTYKANASGFKIDSILKIRDMKTSEGNSNLLAYLLTFIHNSRPQLLNLPVDIKSAAHASRISLDSLTEIVAEKRRTISKLEKIVETYKISNYEDMNGGFDRFLSVIEPFTANAKRNITSVEGNLDKVNAEFSDILAYYGDDGAFKTPQDFFGVFADFSSDFERIKQELSDAQAEGVDLKKKISGVLKAQNEEGRNIIENILGAARMISS